MPVPTSSFKAKMREGTNDIVISNETNNNKYCSYYDMNP